MKFFEHITMIFTSLSLFCYLHGYLVIFLGRPYGVVRCTQNDATGNQSIAEFDEKSLYVVPCNVTLDYLVAVASGSVNSTLKMLPALMVLTSFPETFEAHDVTSALLALSQFYPKAAAKKVCSTSKALGRPTVKPVPHYIFVCCF